MISHTRLCFRLSLLIALAFSTCTASAQELIPFKYKSEEDNKLISENDSVRVYVAAGDTGMAVTINEEILFAKMVYRRNKKKVIAEGTIIAEGDGYVQHGGWMMYHSNGAPKISGSFVKGKPAGAWQEYYTSGKPKKTYHYAILSDKDGTYTCMSGAYNEYYETGGIKVTGFYLAERSRTTDTQTVEDPISGEKKVNTVSRSIYKPRKTGPWEYYNDAGEAEKKEEL